MKKVRILLIVGTLLLVAAVLWGARSYWYITQGEETTGTIVDLVSTGRYIHPVVQFTTKEDVQIQKKLASAGGNFSIGDTLKVYYNPTRPGDFRVDWFVNLWLGPLLLGIGGMVNLVLGIMLPLVLRRKSSK